MADKKVQTIIVGMTGRMDSTVTAYLLKKQGLKVIGVSLDLLELADTEEGLISRCHLPDLKKVKQLCDDMDIPFYAVRSSSIFRSKVLSKAQAARLSGQTYSPCIFCHELILSILVEKMKLLKADRVATGHYAKITHNQTENIFNVLVSGNTSHDQSFLLSRLPQSTLRYLVLPLGELRTLEVEKLSRNILGGIQSFKMDYNFCFMKNKNFTSFVERNTSDTLRKAGVLNLLFEETWLMDHKGIHQYYPSMTEVKDEDGVGIGKKLSVVSISPRTGMILMGNISELTFDRILVHQFFHEGKEDYSRPRRVYIMFGRNRKRYKASMHFKNSKNILLKLDKPVEGLLIAGEHITFFSKEGIAAKLIGSGIVLDNSEFQNIESLKKYDWLDDDEENQDKKEVKNDENMEF